MKLEFSGRVTGVYVPKVIDASKRSVPLALSVTGWVYTPGNFSIGSATAVQYLRVTHWVSYSSYQEEFENWGSHIGSDIVFQFEHMYEKNSNGYGEWRDRFQSLV